MATFVLTAASEARNGTAAGDIFDGHDSGNGVGATGGIDTLNGGAGNDTFLLDGGSAGTIAGGAGTDRVRLFGGDLGSTRFTSIAILDAVGETFSASLSQLASFGRLTNTTFAGAEQIGVDLVGTGGVIDFSKRVWRNEAVAADASALTSGGTIKGSVNGDTLQGSSFNDRLLGLSGDDVLDGGVGADTLAGGSGNDRYRVNSLSDVVYDGAGLGSADRLIVTLSYVLATAQEIEQLEVDPSVGQVNIDLTGNAIAQRLIGNDGDNRLDGRSGADTLQGLLGDDTYLIDNAGDRILEAIGQGSDELFASVSYALGSTTEVETLQTTNQAGIGAIGLTGNALTQTLLGNNGDNRLDGGIGADTLQGFLGNDIYIVDGLSDVIVEALGNGTDTVAASGSYSLVSGVEIERMQTINGNATTAIDLQGNEFAQNLIGNGGGNFLDGQGGADVMRGRGGNDTFVVDEAGDVVIESASGGALDTILTSLDTYIIAVGLEIEGLAAAAGLGAPVEFTGNEFAQRIEGSAEDGNVLAGAGGDDTLIGGSFDTLAGGTGSDTYLIDGNSFKIVEAVGEGSFDNLISVVTVQLQPGVEIERVEVTDGAAIGNEFAQVLIGRGFIDGGGGADTMQGIGGRSTLFYVDDPNDSVMAGAGSDTVTTSVSYQLAAGVEIEVLNTLHPSLTDPLDLTGNASRQIIGGNNGDNRLDGGLGTDTLVGYRGNDTYIVDRSSDDVLEDPNAGTDTVAASGDYSLTQFSSVERLQTVDGNATTAIDLYGNNLSQSISGNAGDNRLNGGLALDTLRGRLGADTFVFSTALGSNNVDTIADFEVPADSIELAAAIFSSIPTGALFSGAFRANFSGLAQDDNDRIIYESDEGNLFYDSDGTGAATAIRFAILPSGLALSNTDFVVV